MTRENIEIKLATFASTAGILFFHSGTFEEFDAENREGIYPAMLVMPINLPLKTRSNDIAVVVELEIFIINRWSREDVESRDSVWDSCDAKALAFVQALDGSENFQTLTPGSIATEAFTHGLSTDNVIAVKYKVSVKVFC